MDAVRGYLQQAEWDETAIREESFISTLDDQGNAKKTTPLLPAIQIPSGICPIEHDSFDVGLISSVKDEAFAFLKQCYIERGLSTVFLPRWEEVQASIDETGTYEQTFDELAYGAKIAWRNSNRCLGRNFWQTLNVRDLRHLETESEMFQAILEHIKLGTNNGDLRANISIFKPDGRKIWNDQYFRYAGYRQPDGTILGDPGNVELTDQALKLGWTRGARTRFDYLPLIIQLPNKDPHWIEIPPKLIMEVPLFHPRYQWFEELELKWYGLPAVSNMVLDLGGIQYTAAPFNGFYMSTEIGARNFSDTYRYNMLPTIAKRIGLDCSQNMTLWKDLALIELNIAVLHSYKQRGVRIVDHHTLTDSFMSFAENEHRCGRPVQADREYILPPISASTTPVFTNNFDGNRKLKPNYFYQSDPWDTAIINSGCPFSYAHN
nr:nitric oxide synthase oxygenase [Dolichospermum sp. UHCC 0259]